MFLLFLLPFLPFSAPYLFELRDLSPPLHQKIPYLNISPPSSGAKTEQFYSNKGAYCVMWISLLELRVQIV